MVLTFNQSFEELLRERITERIKVMGGEIILGPSPDHADYMRRVGIAHGLGLALEMADEINKDLQER